MLMEGIYFYLHFSLNNPLSMSTRLLRFWLHIVLTLVIIAFDFAMDLPKIQLSGLADALKSA